jgi:hypothetical protein
LEVTPDLAGTAIPRVWVFDFCDGEVEDFDRRRCKLRRSQASEALRDELCAPRLFDPFAWITRDEVGEDVRDCRTPPFCFGWLLAFAASSYA